MQIEQFDTGLKTKTNVENIVLSPEKNLQNKNLIRGYLNKIITSGVSEINKNLEEAFITDVKINSFYPINEFEGLKNLKEKIFIPLFEAFPDLERRENIVVGGAFRDKVLVGSYSVLSGYFIKSWLGIKPNYKMINLRCCEIHELKEEKIIESHILIDVMDFLRQCGISSINPSRGSEGAWLPPMNTDGVNFFEKDIEVSNASLRQSLTMNRSLNFKPEKENLSDDELKKRLLNHPQKEYWHEKMIWYGPCGIGTSRSHRILSKGTHLGKGFYGKPTNKDIYYRVIADCACKNNQVYDEWIVRDQGAMVRQIGYSPEEFARKMIEKEGGVSNSSKLYDANSDKNSDYKAESYKDGSIAEKYTQVLHNIFNKSYEYRDYDRAASLFWPGNKLGHGREDIIEKWNSIKKIFTNIKFSIEHVGFLEEPEKNPRVSVRWFLDGEHANESDEYGKASNKKIFIMGINHAEFNNNSIIREWVLFDEVAVWKQILLNHG